jgi:Mg2+-importing ATPase
MGSVSLIAKDHEAGMTFLGFLVLFDPPKPDIVKTIGSLKDLGVSLKIITGDNHLVAANVSQQMGLSNTRIITGPDLRQMSDGALLKRVVDVDVFAEIEPNQKERIMLALRKAGNVVGYMGDGINDASALHATSANFGNMFSMAGVSLFLPFLPLLPKQVLLTNLMTDFPEMTIATDSVDNEMVAYPRRWDIKAIRKFMITFGLVSSVFDYLTVGVLLFILHATPDQFRTGWFLESVVSAALIVLVIRSRKPYGLHCHGGSGEDHILQEGEIMKRKYTRDWKRRQALVLRLTALAPNASHFATP